MNLVLDIKKWGKRIIRSMKRLEGRIMSTGLLRVHLKDSSSYRVFRIFGISIPLTKKVIEGREKNVPVFYLKINRDAAYTLECVQMWLDIVLAMNADYYFVCDNKWLEHKVLSKCCFRDSDIKFIPSQKGSVSDIAKKLCTSNWEAATYAHLTPFYHAKQHGIKQFWNIDADDTMFLLKTEKAAEALKKVEGEALHKGIPAISLDMWLSHTHGQHWSFGVTFISGLIDFTKIFEGVSDKKWMDKYKEYDSNFNLDWFFTYLRDYRNIRIEGFYIENCYFIHWGDLVINPFYSWINLWKNGKLYYPVLQHIYKNAEAGVVDITDSSKICVEATEEEGLDILEYKVSKARNFNSKQRKLFANEDFGNALRKSTAV